MKIQTNASQTPVDANRGNTVAPSKSAKAPLVVDLGDVQIQLYPHQVAKVVEKINEAARSVSQTALRFEVSEEQDIKVRVIDTASGHVIREIPPDKVMDLNPRISDLLGLMLDQRF